MINNISLTDKIVNQLKLIKSNGYDFTIDINNFFNYDNIFCLFNDNKTLSIAINDNFVNIDYYRQFRLDNDTMMQSIWSKQNVNDLDDVLDQLLSVIGNKNKII